jgi:hypothetical protein
MHFAKLHKFVQLNIFVDRLVVIKTAQKCAIHALKMSVSMLTCRKDVVLHSNKPLYRWYLVLLVIFLNRNRITQPCASASVHFSTYFADIS